jgi:Raf kinase inhibitor-like YbhB/YbcL family protein
VKRAALLGAAVAVAGCGAKHATTTATSPATTAAATIKLSSPAFAAGGTIPRQYACPRNVSPPLRWSGLPAGTRELALQMVDIDAPGGAFVHWALAGIPPAIDKLAAGESVPPGAVAGANSFGNLGYGGPCPPAGKPHRYVITLLALPAPSGLRPGFSSGALPTSRALARGELTGLYRR